MVVVPSELVYEKLPAVGLERAAAAAGSSAKTTRLGVIVLVSDVEGLAGTAAVVDDESFGGCFTRFAMAPTVVAMVGTEGSAFRLWGRVSVKAVAGGLSWLSASPVVTAPVCVTGSVVEAAVGVVDRAAVVSDFGSRLVSLLFGGASGADLRLASVSLVP
jgi:hypothetical protein